MIINIRGTSGSGKSTVVRKIMDLYTGGKAKFFEPGRKQPIGYVFQRGNLLKYGRSLAIIGHYETPCGGCDTINGQDHIFNLVRQAHDNGNDVLFEGLLLSAEVNRMAQLHDAGYDARVVVLDVPLETCLASVNGRRQAKRPGAPPVNPDNTAAKHKGTQMAARRLQERGVPVCTADRDAAFDYIRSLLEI